MANPRFLSEGHQKHGQFPRDSRPTINTASDGLLTGRSGHGVTKAMKRPTRIFESLLRLRLLQPLDGLKERGGKARSLRDSRVSLFLFTCSPNLAAFPVLDSVEPLTGDRPDGRISAWTRVSRRYRGASCRVTWCSREGCGLGAFSLGTPV